MKGVNAYSYAEFHPDCPGLQVLDSAGFLYLHCPDHKVVCNLQAVAARFQRYTATLKPVGVRSPALRADRRRAELEREATGAPEPAAEEVAL